MTRGGKFLLLGGCLAATGCATDQTVQVRAISDPHSKLHYSGGLLAEARGQLAMGAVGLALESFRTLQRQQPGNSDVYAGIAACYAQMGRYDLTRTNYELALAYAPNDPALLQALASTLDSLGESKQAAQVREEVRTAAAKSVQPHLTETRVTPLGVPRATTMTVKVPDASPPAKVQAAAEPRIASPVLSLAKVSFASSSLVNATKPVLAATEVTLPVENSPAPVASLPEEPAKPLVLPAAAVDVSVPRLNEVAPRALTVAASVLATDYDVTAGTVAAVVQPTAAGKVGAVGERSLDPHADARGPFLARTSMREVALITVATPRKQSKLEPRPSQLPQIAKIDAPPADRPPVAPAPRQLLAASEVRWLPLRYAPRTQPIQLLNAARADGLAARTRVALVDRGWRKVSIGNARAARQHSLVLYSPGRWRVAARLAAQLRCKAVRMASVKNVVVLLGRDAAFRRGTISRA